MLAALALGGCAPLRVLDATVPSGGLRTETGLAYGPHPRQLLDVWRPEQPTGPVVVWFYGGAWRTGDRADYRFVAVALARAGIVTVIPDYRLYPDAPFPAFVEDAAAATAWAAERFPGPVFLAGHSAGAHIAMLLALDARRLARAGYDRGRLAGAIGLAGPYDFLPIQDPEVQAVFAAATDPHDTQPITFADAAAPPLLLLTGEDDTTVGPYNSANLAAKVGGRATLRRYPGIGHAGILTALTPLFRTRAPVAEDMLAFIAARSALPATG